MSERPLRLRVQLEHLRRGPAPKTSRMPIAQIAGETRASAMYSTSSPQSRKKESRGPNSSTRHPRVAEHLHVGEAVRERVSRPAARASRPASAM